MRMTTAVILSIIALLPTLLPLSSIDWWWVRIWDFPLLVQLSHEPEHQSEQELPRADEAERRQAEEKLERVREER